MTSIRRGFAGGGFEGGQSLPKQMAMAAGVPGADLIPDTAELFLGFTSTQKAALGPPQIANFETLGYVGPRSGRATSPTGTHMHLSHIFEDLAAWYQTFDFQARVDTTFRPGLDVPPGRRPFPRARSDTQTAAAGRARLRSAPAHRPQRVDPDRLAARSTTSSGRTARGTRRARRSRSAPTSTRWTTRSSGRPTPNATASEQQPAAGLHFVVFNPTSDDFRRVRLAMDGVLPDGTTLRFDASSAGQGFNQVLTTTHRQNFLVPPRRHRSFPLAG